MQKKLIIVLVLAIAATAFMAVSALKSNPMTTGAVTDYASCMKAGGMADKSANPTDCSFQGQTYLNPDRD